jgi:hypothetical protein
MVEQENTVQVIDCPQWRDAKTLFHNTIFFLKYSAFIITHLLFTVFVSRLV